MKFKYIGDCAAGEVVFQVGKEKVVMRKNESVEVPEALAKKLETNNHFEAVKPGRPKAAEVA